MSWFCMLLFVLVWVSVESGQSEFGSKGRRQIQIVIIIEHAHSIRITAVFVISRVARWRRLGIIVIDTPPPPQFPPRLVSALEMGPHILPPLLTSSTCTF